MKKKELLKQLIAGFQAGLPVEVYPRELMLPVDSNKIITVPGVRRCGKSSLFLLVINQLISEKGIRKEQILFLNFDDERLQFDAENFDEILQAYRELYPDISLKDVYMFFDEIQMAEDWQPFVHRVYEQECRHIFITGSNSNMLSSELATSLRGRTLQYEEFPNANGSPYTFAPVISAIIGFLNPTYAIFFPPKFLPFHQSKHLPPLCL